MMAAANHVRLGCGLVGWGAIGAKAGFCLVAHSSVDAGVRGGDVDGDVIAGVTNMLRKGLVPCADVEEESCSSTEWVSPRVNSVRKSTTRWRTCPSKGKSGSLAGAWSGMASSAMLVSWGHYRERERVIRLVNSAAGRGWDDIQYLCCSSNW